MSYHPRFTRRQRSAIAQLWITSVGGTALVILVQAIGQDWSNWVIWPQAPVDWGFTADRAVRYLFAIWFSAYLVLAYLANEARPDPSMGGVLFDVAQSIFVFAALGMLGFVTQNFHIFEDKIHYSLSMAFLTIVFVAGVTLIRHIRADGVERAKTSDDDPEQMQLTDPIRRRLQFIRAAVLIFGAIAGVYERFWGPRTIGVGCDWEGTLFFIVLMYVGLYAYSTSAFQAKA